MLYAHLLCTSFPVILKFWQHSIEILHSQSVHCSFTVVFSFSSLLVCFLCPENDTCHVLVSFF